MEPVKDTMADRCEHDSGDDQEHQARIERVDSFPPDVCGCSTGPMPPSNIAALRNPSSQLKCS
jgi:hypothetical protein